MKAQYNNRNGGAVNPKGGLKFTVNATDSLTASTPCWLGLAGTYCLRDA